MLTSNAERRRLAVEWARKPEARDDAETSDARFVADQMRDYGVWESDVIADKIMGFCASHRAAEDSVERALSELRGVWDLENDEERAQLIEALRAALREET